MKVAGNISFDAVGNNISIIPTKQAYPGFRNFIEAWHRKQKGQEEKQVFKMSMEFSGVIMSAKQGRIEMIITDTPTLEMETFYQVRKLNQNNTYYGILYFMFWAQNGRKPVGEETQPYNEALMQMYAPMVEEKNPLTGRVTRRLKRQSKMTTVEFAQLIEGALSWLVTMDIPKSVQDVIGKEMKKLWRSWYEWKNAEENIMAELEPDDMTYDQYSAIHPACEFTGLCGSENNPVVRVHLVANLQSTPYYEQPWSYVRGLQSIHISQHSEGWEPIFKEYPHIRRKWERAQTLAKLKGIDSGSNNTEK